MTTGPRDDRASESRRDVLRVARHPGYVLIGPADRVFRRHHNDPACVERVPHHEHDSVTGLITTGALTVGERCRVTYGSRSGPAHIVDLARGAADVVSQVAPQRVLVTGSRTWNDARTLRAALAQAWRDGARVLVVGACPAGADAPAEQCRRGWGGRVERHPADWTTHGRSAEFRRNATMVSTGADLCLAFIRENSRGATHAARLAERAGIPTRRYRR